jgi:hypothetical protein
MGANHFRFAKSVFDAWLANLKFRLNSPATGLRVLGSGLEGLAQFPSNASVLGLASADRALRKSDPERAKIPISIRLDGSVLATLKTEAERLGIPYQTYIGWCSTGLPKVN